MNISKSLEIMGYQINEYDWCDDEQDNQRAAVHYTL